MGLWPSGTWNKDVRKCTGDVFFYYMHLNVYSDSETPKNTNRFHEDYQCLLLMVGKHSDSLMIHDSYALVWPSFQKSRGLKYQSFPHFLLVICFFVGHNLDQQRAPEIIISNIPLPSRRMLSQLTRSPLSLKKEGQSPLGNIKNQFDVLVLLYSIPLLKINPINPQFC